jgi:hypothetical protein
LDTALTDIYNNNRNIREAVDAWRERNPDAYKTDPDPRARAVEEVMARRSEQGPVDASVFAKLAAVVKDFARRMGLKVNMTDGEVSAILAMAHDMVIRGRRSDRAANGVRYMYTGEKAFSGNEYEAKQREQSRQAAERMESSGRTPDQIRLDTGWFRNLNDNKWRYEIADDVAKLTPEFDALPESKFFGDLVETTLDKVLDHPALFNAYPELKDVRVIKQRGLFDFFGGLQGWFSSEKNMLNITPYAEDKLSTMLHEIQHWIQDKEGFAAGGNQESAVDSLPPARIERLAAGLITEKQSELEKLAVTIKALKAVSATDLIGRLSLNEARTYQDLAKEEKAIYEKLDELKRTDPEAVANKVRADAIWSALKLMPRGTPEYEATEAEWLAAYRAVKTASPEIEQLEILLQNAYRQRVEAENPLSVKLFGTGTLSSAQQSARYEIQSSLKNNTVPKDINTKVEAYAKTLAEITTIQSGDIEGIRKLLVSSSEAFKLYRGLAGEIESRDVQARQKYTAEQRAAEKPLTSETYAPEDVTVTYAKTGVSSSAALPKRVLKGPAAEGGEGAAVDAGLMSREEYQRLVDIYKPVRPFTSVPEMPTQLDLERGLKKNQIARIGQETNIPEGGHPFLRQVR